MEFNFTKGPWSLEYDEFDDIWCVCHERTECSETTVCNFVNDDEEKANARLISCAPDMLMALIENTKHQIGMTVVGSDTWHLCMENIKIIEKATGKSWSEING